MLKCYFKTFIWCKFFIKYFNNANILNSQIISYSIIITKKSKNITTVSSQHLILSAQVCKMLNFIAYATRMWFFCNKTTLYYSNWYTTNLTKRLYTITLYGLKLAYLFWICTSKLFSFLHFLNLFWNLSFIYNGVS